MKSILIAALLTAAVGLADSWNGKLVDQSCMERQQSGGASTQPDQQNACAPSRTTTVFGVEMADGRVLRLDSTGNAKAAEMMHNVTGPKQVMVTVTGTQNGKTLRVETIEMQQ